MNKEEFEDFLFKNKVYSFNPQKQKNRKINNIHDYYNYLILIKGLDNKIKKCMLNLYMFSESDTDIRKILKYYKIMLLDFEHFNDYYLKDPLSVNEILLIEEKINKLLDEKNIRLSKIDKEIAEKYNQEYNEEKYNKKNNIILPNSLRKYLLEISSDLYIKYYSGTYFINFSFDTIQDIAGYHQEYISISNYSYNKITPVYSQYSTTKPTPYINIYSTKIYYHNWQKHNYYNMHYQCLNSNNYYNTLEDFMLNEYREEEINVKSAMKKQ